MNYRETLEYLYSRLPAFTRIGKAAYKADLNNIRALSEALGNPHQQFKSIHIAGTNGKGSSSHFLASIFQEAGYKTGLFTSPHLKDFRERIRVNGRCITRQAVVRFTEQHRRLFEQLQPSFFEMTVALAFQHFARQKVDIAMIETGLGGRLDSTNILRPECSLITNISFDHTDLLGNTLEKIAAEKAGIIKKGIPVVIAELQTDILHVFQRTAHELQANLTLAGEQIQVGAASQHMYKQRMILKADALLPGKKILRIHSPLPGLYQVKNLKGVLETCRQMQARGWNLSKKSIEQGIRNVVENTGLRGRWEVAGRNPWLVFDTGHNEAGVREILRQLQAMQFDRLHIVWGMVADKEIANILALLPPSASYYFCNANLPRALAAGNLQAQAAAAGLTGAVYRSVKIALKAALKQARKNDLVLVGGSTFVVAEAL